MKKELILLALAVLALLFVVPRFVHAPVDHTQGPEEAKLTDLDLFNNLELPFNISDINDLMGEINPIGVVRFSLDESGTGHSGLDVPLKFGAPIKAVADGKIVLTGEAGDSWGGKKAFQLLKPTRSGEGWAFLYEHIKLADDLKVGKEYKTGDIIGTKAAPDGYTAHFQLSYNFSDYEYIRDVQCWVDMLSEDSFSKLNQWWEKYQKSPHLLGSWRTTFEEGKFPFKGLLDKIAYPDGPQLCYDLGTDVR